MAWAFDTSGFEAIDVHMTDLLAGRVALAQMQGLVAVGGFSYGDQAVGPVRRVLRASGPVRAGCVQRLPDDEPAEEHHPRCRALAAVPPQCQRAVRSPHRAAGGGGVAGDPVARHGRFAPAGGGGAWRRPGGV
ncbi:hypothetical protein G6F32_015190 [Rhizopus arrhizus]|nr:hypothetical protein G6F32_015190 [Rhizopus arrhizus]